MSRLGVRPSPCGSGALWIQGGIGVPEPPRERMPPTRGG